MLAVLLGYLTGGRLDFRVACGLPVHFLTK
jgi:hypothetical protein